MAARGVERTWTAGTQRQAMMASDALPLYLSGAAVLLGEDPTTQEGLQVAYDRRKVTARAAIFSNLYPASAGVVLQPLAQGTWPRFIEIWRGLLLLGALLAGAGAALASVRGRGAPLAVAVGIWLATAGFPVTAECISLGQANLLMGGLMAVAMAGLRRSWPGVPALAAIAGASVKLVPGAVFLPVLAARRWRELAVGAVLGLVVLGLTVSAVPLERVISGVRATLQFQGAISPDWLNDVDAPEWVVFVGDWRHRATQVLTVVLVLATAAWTRHRGSPEQTAAVTAGGVALLTAWLGADAAGFHVLYAPLYIPALVYLATWPLDEDAPLWSWPVGLLAGAAPWLALDSDLAQVSETFALTVAGLGLWGGVLLRLAWRSVPLPWPVWPVLGLVVGWGAAWGDVVDERPRGPSPDALGGQVESYGLPEGVGHGGPAPGRGFLDPNTDRPAADTLAGTRLERVLAPEAAHRLTGHLNQGPRRWEAVDDPLAAVLASEAPLAPAAHAAYGEVVIWMALQHYAARTLEGPGVEAASSELERTLRVLARHPQR